MTWYDLINFLLIGTCLATLVIRWRSLGRSLPLFIPYFLCTLLLEVLAEISILRGNMNNLIYYHLMVPLQYGVLCYYFLTLFKKNRDIALLALSLFPIPLMYFISFTYEGASHFYSFTSVVKNIITSFFVILLLRSKILNDQDSDPLIDTDVLVCSGLFINSLGKFLIEGSMNYLLENDQPTSMKLFYLDISLDFLFYTVFIISILFRKKTQALHQ